MVASVPKRVFELATSLTARAGPYMYLSPADKYHRLTHRPSQGQKGLDERAIMTSPWSSHPW